MPEIKILLGVSMDYRSGKISQQIIAMQNSDGTWGNEFHSLSIPNNKKPLTTEQALRHLKLLGFTILDEPIKKAVDCMVSCLSGERKIDNYREKGRDWDSFTKLMLSTWVKIFQPQNEVALECAKYWVTMIETEFANGKYDKDTGEVDFVTFYEMNLLQGLLSETTESRMLDYVINHEKGIYYIYGKRIRELPKEFQSVETSRYLEAIDILSGYKLAKDNLYFPLSDSWRSAECRKADCTAKITAIIDKLKS